MFATLSAMRPVRVVRMSRKADAMPSERSSAPFSRFGCLLLAGCTITIGVLPPPWSVAVLSLGLSPLLLVLLLRFYWHEARFLLRNAPGPLPPLPFVLLAG